MWQGFRTWWWIYGPAVTVYLEAAALLALIAFMFVAVTGCYDSCEKRAVERADRHIAAMEACEASAKCELTYDDFYVKAAFERMVEECQERR